MIGKKIKDLRMQKGITQEALSKALGVSAQAVSKWEQCLTSPDISLLVPLADYFGVSLDALLRENQDLQKLDYESLVEIRVEKIGRHWRFRAKNISDITLKSVSVKAVFYDNTNEVVDYTNMGIYDLEPGMSRPETVYSSMEDCIEQMKVIVTDIRK